MPPLNLKDIAILKAAAYYRYLTVPDVTKLLFSEGSSSYVSRRLTALAGGTDYQTNQYLYRFPLPSERGNSWRVFTLGSRGKAYLEDSGFPVGWQMRPDRVRHLTPGQVAHTLLVTRFLVGTQVYSRDRSLYSLLEMRISYEMQELKDAIPDGWLLLEIGGTKYAVLLELDRGMEQRDKFKEHVKGRIALVRSGRYQQFFGVPGVVIAYVTTGQRPEYSHSRLNAMTRWTREVAEHMKVPSWAALFHFTAVDYDSLYEAIPGLFREAVWLRPDTTERVRLFA